MPSICFNRALEVIGGKIAVPGCEPTSAMSSDIMARFRTCQCAMVSVNDALAAIPGSYLRFGDNWSNDGPRKRWFVLPAECKACPCDSDPDYYGILRDLCDDGPPDQNLDDCEVIWNTNSCMLPDLLSNEIAAQEVERERTYQEEGVGNIGTSLWGSSPWFLYQVKAAEAAGVAPPTVPNSQIPAAAATASHETVVKSENQGIQYGAEMPDVVENGDFNDLEGLFG